MEERRPRGHRLRWTIGTLMALVAASGIALKLARPVGAPQAIRAGAALLKERVPGFDPTRSRAIEVATTADHAYWRVQFARVGEPGARRYTVTIPDRRVRSIHNLW